MVESVKPVSTTREIPLWQKSIVLMSGAVISVIIVFALHWGRPLFLPIALAILLTLLLNPVVTRFQQLGMNRLFAVLVAVSLSCCALFIVVSTMTQQVGHMLADLPRSTSTLQAKARMLRRMGSGQLISDIEKMVETIIDEFKTHIESSKPQVDPESESRDNQSAQTVVVARDESVPWVNFTGVFNSAFEFFTTFAFAPILLTFFLLGREDLRDRMVVLAGKARLALTSKALEDITNRISRYLGMVALINGGFGVILTLGLLALQVPYAVLWGFLAAALRFIPFIGVWIGAAFPILMSLAAFEGWRGTVVVLAFVLTLELLCNNVVEPLIFGHSTGVSPIALLIFAAFWFYLWGPIGLVLATPIAVCLVVVGKNIPQLSFLRFLLGDAPPLRADLGLYQRLMLDDQLAAESIVENRLKSSDVTEVFDELLIPSLILAKRDVARGDLADKEDETIAERVRNLIEKSVVPALQAKSCSSEKEESAQDRSEGTGQPAEPPVRILGYPAMEETDSLALEMLQQSLDPKVWHFETMSTATLTSELLERLAEDPPAALCIASLPPGGLTPARYLCKRLKVAYPDLPIIVGRWGTRKNPRLDIERLKQGGATFVTTSLAETQRLLQSRLPILAHSPTVLACHDDQK